MTDDGQHDSSPYSTPVPHRPPCLRGLAVPTGASETTGILQEI